MKKDIHPKMNDVIYIMTNGEKIHTRTAGKGGEQQLDIDVHTHSAWTGSQTLRKTGQVEKFSNKYGSLFGAN